MQKSLRKKIRKKRILVTFFKPVENMVRNLRIAGVGGGPEFLLSVSASDSQQRDFESL